MTYDYCPCCQVTTLPHLSDCTFHVDCPAECEQFDRERQALPMLTDAEREAIAWVCGDVADITGPIEKTLRGLLERHCPTSETRSLQDNDPSASENLPTGNDTQKKHCNSDKFTDR